MIVQVTSAAALFLFSWWRIALEDKRSFKIRNSLLKRFLLLAAALYSVLAVNSLAALGGLTGLYHNANFYQGCGIHLGLSALAAVSLWYLRIWPAGDAKLFVYAQMLVPLILPQTPLLPLRFFLITLINIFIPSALFYALQAVIWSWWKRMKPRLEFYRSLGQRGFWKHLKTEFAAQRSLDTLRTFRDGYRDFQSRDAQIAKLNMLAGFLLLALLQKSLEKFFGVNWTRLAPFSALLIAYSMNAIKPKASPVATGAFILFSMIAAAAGSSIYQGVFQLAAQFAVFAFAMGLAARFVFAFFKNDNALFVGLPVFGLTGCAAYLLGGKTWFLWVSGGAAVGLIQPLIQIFQEENIRMVAVSSIEPYTLLAPPAVEWLKKDPDFFEEHFSTLYPDGLTTQQARVLRERCLEEGVREIAAVKTEPFAFWILLGTVLTVLIQDSVLNLLRE